MGTIFLARHGQNKDNAEMLLNGHRDRPLTALGKRQAQAVAESLKDKGISVVYSSPLCRSFETASIIADVLGLGMPIKNDLFIERDFGILTGKRVSEIPRYATELLQTEHVLYFLEAEGAESFPELRHRGSKALRFVQERHSSETVLIVSHGDIGKMMKAAHHGTHWVDSLQEGYFSHTTVYELR